MLFYRKGTGCPKILKIDVRGDLMEGNTVRGYAEVAWCGGTPGKGVARYSPIYLLIKWYFSDKKRTITSWSIVSRYKTIVISQMHFPLP